jgi:hypothetical protein
MSYKPWLLALGVALVLGVGVLSRPDATVQASNCGPPDYTCPQDQCCSLGTCYPLTDPACSGSGCGTCSTLYEGHTLYNNCAYNGGSGACYCPLPGTIIDGCP